jgi:hypothetical protein
VAYTADFRVHGTKPQLTGDFIDLAAKYLADTAEIEIPLRGKLFEIMG